MTRIVFLLSAFLSIATIAAAQAPPPAVGTAQGLQVLYATLKRDVTASAQKLPESDYAFRPTSEIRTFGQLIGHFADAQFLMCAPAKGGINPRQGQPSFETLTSKAEIQKALADSFAFCDEAFSSLTEENAGQLLPGAPMTPQQMSRGLVLFGVLWHGREVYGISTVYLRLKGLVPPSTETAAAGRGRGATNAGSGGDGRGR